MKPVLVAVDVDGTIAGADHVPSERTRATLARLGLAGIDGMIVTGRAEFSALRTARDVAFTAPAISCNGAVITEPLTGRRLWEKQMDPDDVRRAAEVAYGCDCAVTVWTADDWFVERPTPSSDLLALLLERQPVVRPLEDVIATERVVKLMVGGPPEVLDRHASAIVGSLEGMVRSMDRFFEAGPVGVSKAEALLFTLDHLGIDPSQCWGFGDSDGDVGWMSLLGRAVATANAFPSVLAIADAVAGHHDEDGVAEYLERELELSGSSSGMGAARSVAQNG